ncbi:MAG: DUF305 domain-containing protein [Gemmatimonadaceae bacterium]
MLAAAVAVAACTACSSAPRGAARPTSQPTSPQPAADGGGDLAAIAKARADSARHPYTAADVHFMSAMIGHHTQAIVMAGWAPTHGANASVRTLAERIVNAQQDEIAIMRQWLRDRRQPVPGAAPTGMKMKSGAEHEMHHEVQGGVLMPGMLSEAQLKQLDGARGTEFDRLFLTFMIQHHRGATAMVKELFGTYGAAQDETVFKFASDVNVDQTTEIARMERMLVVLMIESRSR